MHSKQDDKTLFFIINRSRNEYTLEVINMFCIVKLRTIVSALCLFAAICLCVQVFLGTTEAVYTDGQKEYIKWMEFNADTKVLKDAMSYDIESADDDYPISWIDIVAYLAAKNGNNFKNYNSSVKMLYTGAPSHCAGILTPSKTAAVGATSTSRGNNCISKPFLIPGPAATKIGPTVVSAYPSAVANDSP